MRPHVKRLTCWAAFLACAALCGEPPAPLPAADTLSITANEFRAAEHLLVQLASERDVPKRAEFAKTLRQMTIADPAKAVLWELWLEGKRTEFAGKVDVLNALPKAVRKQALLLGRYSVDMEAMYRWFVENDEDFEDSEEAKQEFMIEMQPIAEIRFSVESDGTFKGYSDKEKETDTGTWNADTDNGRFTAISQEKQYLRGLIKDGNVFLKFPIDLKEICLPMQLKRLDPSPRLALAALLEPMARAVESARRRPLRVPASIAGIYESEDATMSLTIGADGALSIQFQAHDGAKQKAFAAGHAAHVSEGRAEFDCEIDFFAAPSNSVEPAELTRFTSTFDQKGQQLTQKFKDEKGAAQTVIWIKVK